MTNLFISFDLSLNYLWFFSMLSALFIPSHFFSNFKSMFLELIKMEFFKFMETLKYTNWTKGLMMINFFLMFMFMMMNYSSIMPFVFSVSSQMSVVLFISGVMWGSIVLESLINSYKNFFLHLIPEGSPTGISIFLFLIELVSVMIRPLTLSIRMVANIMAGHLLMILMCKLIFWVNFSFMGYLILVTMEFYVSIIQSYIFVTLISLYFSEI